MIFKLTFPDRIEYVQAKNLTELHVEYNREYDDHEDLEMTETISDEEAKEIMLTNSEFNPELPEDDENYREFSLFDACCGDSFCVIGSTEWD